jgi:hypothetical protein
MIAFAVRFLAVGMLGAAGLLGAVGMLGAVGFMATECRAQGPGTPPPPGLFQNPQPWPEQLEGIRPEAFLFQDESNTPVVMPRMSFEEIDRLRKLDRGARSADRVATLERLSINGTIAASRAEFSAVLNVRLDGVAVREMIGQSVVVDIGMAGTHLLEAVDVRFASNEQTSRDSKDKPGDAGESVEGAYLRLQASDASTSLSRDRPSAASSLIETGVPVPPANPADSPRSSEMAQTGDANAGLPPRSLDGVSSDAAFLPANFPAALRQAIGTETSGFLRPGGGYQLVLPVESLLEQLSSPRRSVLLIVSLKLSARVWSTPQRQTWLPLNLPTVTTSMEVKLDDPRAAGKASELSVVGTGQEVVRRLDEFNRFAIECDGGLLVLRVSGAPETATETGELIEVESETQLQWESPTEPPTMDTRLLAKNLRGPLRHCTLVLPPATVLVSPPEILSATNDLRNADSSNTDNSGAESGKQETTWWEVTVSRPSDDEAATASASVSGGQPNNSQPTSSATQIQVRWMGTDQMQPPQSVRIRLQLRQFPPESTAAQPWVLQIPQVNEAIGHRGRVTIRTVGDHRLRWRPRLGIDAIVSEQTADKNGDAVYPFRFSQTRFELPVWLSGKQQQVRVAADVELEVARRAARVQIDVQAGGVGIDPKGLRLDLGVWRLLGIKADNRSTQLEVNANENLVEWQVDTSDGNWPTKYQITAEWLADANTDNFSSLTLPRVVSSDPATVLSDVRLTLPDGRRESWLVDLTNSPSLQRVTGQSESQFRFLTPESAWTLRGSFASRPLQLQWLSNVAITQSSDQWLIRSQWTVTSPLDLEGRLRFSRPVFAGSAVSRPKIEGETPQPSIDPENAASASDPAKTEDPITSRWTAIVDGQPAMVRQADQDVDTTDFAAQEFFEIISPNLDTGSHLIELVTTQKIVTQTIPSQPPSNPDSSLSSNLQQGEIASLLAIPSLVADQVELKSEVKINMPVGVVDASGVFWKVLPNMDGVLGNLRGGAQFEFAASGSTSEATPADLTQTNGWVLGVIPDFPIPLLLRSRVGEEKLTEIPRSFLRSLVGKQFRHEHLLATIRGGRRVRLGLPPSLQTIRVEVLLDGKPVAYSRDASGLRIDLPTETQFTIPPATESAAATPTSEPLASAVQKSGRVDTASSPSQTLHLLDVRIWTEEPNNPWWSRCQPLLRLPVGSGLQYWQLVVPTDSHLYWASSQSGRAMRWEREQLKMSRVPAISDPSLIRWALDVDWQFGENNVGRVLSSDASDSDAVANESDQEQIMQAAVRDSLANATFTVPGNRYLFFAGSTFSFDTLTVSRTVLWLAVGGLVLLLAATFQWFPSLHHPIVAFLLAIGFVGLLVIAPDGIVLTAQLVMISLTLVAVFYAISAVSVPRDGRALQPRAGSRDSVVVRGSGSQRASGKTPRRDSVSGPSETRDFEPRYVPTQNEGPGERSRGNLPAPPSPDESASRSGTQDVSDPDSTEAAR